VVCVRLLCGPGMVNLHTSFLFIVAQPLPFSITLVMVRIDLSGMTAKKCVLIQGFN